MRQRKIALLGFRSVGKSSLANQFVQGQFIDHYEPTIENTFTKRLNVRGTEYELSLVDTAGQDESSTFPLGYSVNFHGYVLVYSIDSHKSFEVCEVIHEKLTDLVGDHNVPIVLVGNKCDLETDRRVSLEEGKLLASRMKAVFLETSAMMNQGVSEVFQKILSEIEKDSSSHPDKNKTCVIS